MSRSPTPIAPSIVGSSFAHSLRRRWKLALAVFLFGAAIAVMTHAAGPLGFAQDAVATLDDLTGEGEPGQAEVSSEQAGEPRTSILTLLAYAALGGFLYLVFSFGSLVVGFIMPGDMVGEERRSGAIMIWAQHPMSLTSFYLRRYLGVQAANLVAQALFALVAALAITPGRLPLADLGIFLRFCIGGLLACAITFAATALGARRAAFVALAYYLGSRFGGGIVGSLAAGGESLEWVATALRLLVFPAGPLRDFGAGVGAGAWDWGATGLILYHFALWTALALFGLRRLERRPLAL